MAHAHSPDSFWGGILKSMGLVFGDIGTSPIYAFRETFAGHHPLALDTLHLMGVVSLIFWAMTVSAAS